MMALLLAYRRERLPLSLLAIVSILITATVQTVTRHGPAGAGATAALVAVLFARFRIWDDLADIERDAKAHPTRVLVRAPSTRPFETLATVLTGVAAGAMAFAGATRSVWGYALLVAGTAAFYRRRRARTVTSHHFLLLKYPAFVWIAATVHGAAPWSPRLWLAAASTYLAACVYEAAHDPAAASIPALVAGEAILFVISVTCLALGGVS